MASDADSFLPEAPNSNLSADEELDALEFDGEPGVLDEEGIVVTEEEPPPLGKSWGYDFGGGGFLGGNWIDPAARPIQRATNPSFEVDLADWGPNNSPGWAVAPAFTRVTDWADRGVASLRGVATNAADAIGRIMTFRTVVQTIPAVPGEVVPVGAVVNHIGAPGAGAGSPGSYINVTYYDDALSIVPGGMGVAMAESSVVGAGANGRYELGLLMPPAPPDTAYLRVALITRSVLADEVVDVRWDAVRVGTEEYGDGDMFGWAWSGTPHASASYRYATGPVARGPVATYGLATLRQWIEKCLYTERGSHPIHPPDYGVEGLLDVIGDPTNSVIAGDLEERIRDALLFHPRISDVRDFDAFTGTIEDEDDEVLYLSFTVVTGEADVTFDALALGVG